MLLNVKARRSAAAECADADGTSSDENARAVDSEVERSRARLWRLSRGVGGVRRDRMRRCVPEETVTSWRDTWWGT